MSDAEDVEVSATILDYLPHGHQSADHHRFDTGPLAQAIDLDRFRLYELDLGDEANVGIADEVRLRPAGDVIQEFREIDYEDLTSGSAAELEYVVEEAIEEDPERFLAVYNDAQPITLRLHQLNLLPGIGDKLRDDILEARKQGPYESFVDLQERVSGLHDPKQVLIDRILAELRDEDIKYALFANDGPY